METSNPISVHQATPFLLSARDKIDVCDSVLFVVTPLNSIMMDQCRQLSEKGVNSCYLDFVCESGFVYGEEEEELTTESDDQIEGEMFSSVRLEEVKQGKYNLVYAHPESLMCHKGRRLLRSMRKKICALAIDEAHIILEW